MSFKYTAAIAEHFVDLYRTGRFTLTELCKAIDITPTTFYHWKEHNANFKKKLEQADKHRLINIKEIATKGLVKLLEGGEQGDIVEEFTVTTRPIYKYPWLEEDDPMQEILTPAGTHVLIGYKRTTKILMPDAKSVQFALRNADRENYPDTQKAEVKNTGNATLPVIITTPASIKFDFPSNTVDESESKQD